MIDANYLNSRFEKYLRTLHNRTATAEERASVFEELHRSFSSRSQDEQRFAEIFLHEVEQGRVSLGQGKTVKDYIVEYQSKAQNDSIHEVAQHFGLTKVCFVRWSICILHKGISIKGISMSTIVLAS